MHLSTRSRMSMLISFLVIFIAVATIMLGLFAAHGISSHAASAPQYSATKGTLTLSTDLNDVNAGATAYPKGARHLHNWTNANSQVVVASTTMDTQTGQLLHNFNGVGSRASGNANFGAEFEPPDQGLCVGNGFVVEPVNSAYTIYHTNGSIVAGPFNVNRLFHDGFKQFTSDPRCYFDQSTNTWFAVVLFLSANNKQSREDIAVNPTGDPTKPWSVFRLDTTDAGGNGCPCFGDQPRLGIDNDNIYISTDEFSNVGPQFNGAQIFAISKSQLVHLAHSVNFVVFKNLNIAGSLALSVQPAITSGPADAEYFLDSLDFNGPFARSIGVWALTGGARVSQGGTPTLSSVVITSERYGIPPPAAQKGAKSKLDSGDDRMQQTQFINGDIWGELDTAVSIPGDPIERAGAAWFRVHPTLHGRVIRGADIVHQGYVALTDHYLLYPALQVNAAGSAAMIFTLSGSDVFPSAAYAAMQSGQNAFGPVHVAAFGTTNYDPKATRWGDYSWAVLDPNGKSVWLATEYIPPAFSQTVDGKRNWGTRVIDVSV